MLYLYALLNCSEFKPPNQTIRRDRLDTEIDIFCKAKVAIGSLGASNASIYAILIEAFSVMNASAVPIVT